MFTCKSLSPCVFRVAEHELLGDSDGGGLDSLLKPSDGLTLPAVSKHQEHVSVSDALLGPAGQVTIVITLGEGKC